MWWRRAQQQGDDAARRIVVSGIVQGVGFRAATVRQAQAAGVAGWVRNRRDGSVEVWVEGDQEAVAELVDWLADGPRHATVTDRDVTEEQPQGYSSFDIDR